MWEKAKEMWEGRRSAGDLGRGRIGDPLDGGGKGGTSLSGAQNYPLKVNWRR